MSADFWRMHFQTFTKQFYSRWSILRHDAPLKRTRVLYSTAVVSQPDCDPDWLLAWTDVCEKLLRQELEFVTVAVWLTCLNLSEQTSAGFTASLCCVDQPIRKQGWSHDNILRMRQRRTMWKQNT